MSDEPENLILIYLRRLDAKIDALRDDMTGINSRLTALEIQVGHLADRMARRLHLGGEHA